MKKQFRRIASMVLTLLMILALASCGDGNTTGGANGGANGGATGGATGGGDEVYELSFNTFIPEVIAPGKATREALDYILAEAGGRIEFKDYWDGTYVSFAETIQAVVTGVIDIGFIDPGHLNESFYANQIISMNIEADVPSRKGQSEALTQAINEIPQLQEEMDDMGLLWLGAVSAGSGILHLVGDVEVRKPEDLRGMSMEALAAGNELLKACGAAAIGSPVTEWYTGMQRNVIGAVIHNWGAVDGFKFNEVAKTHMCFTSEEDTNEDSRGLYVSTMGFIMNKEKFASLPKDLQDLLIYGFGDKYAEFFLVHEMAACLSGYTQAVEDNHKFIYLTPTEVQAWRDKVAESNTGMLERITANGWDANDIYTKWNAILQAKYDEEAGK